jgi:transposase
MSNNLVTMQQLRILIQLLQKGFSGRRIAGELKLSRNTVKQYKERLLSGGRSIDGLQQLGDAELSAIVYAGAKQTQPDSRRTDFESRTEYFIAELRRTGVTKQLLWEEYKLECADGYEYSQFCELFGQHENVTNATMHFSYLPAEVMMIDFAGDMLHYVHKDTGELVACPVFVCVLPYSGYSFAVALADARQPNVIKALNQCLAWFGGAPHSLKCDNMKTAVSKSCRYEPVFTETLQQWGLHNNIMLTAARVRKPKDKAPVESEVKFIYQRVYATLRNLTFFSLKELNIHICQQLSLYHNRPFQKKDRCRMDCFTGEEQLLLQSLPATSYEIKHTAQAKVQKNYHVTLGEDWHHYSVPFNNIGKTITAVYDSDIVELYYQNTRIAIHTRSFKPHAYTTIKEHMPQNHRYYTEQRGWDGQYFTDQALLIGPNTHQYIVEVLKARYLTEQTYNGCLGILRLAKAYTPVRLEAACKRALTGKTFNYSTVNKILSNNMDTLETIQGALFTMPEHTNLRGPKAYE